MSDHAKTTSDYWGTDRGNTRVSWLQHPTCVEYLCERVTGDPRKHTYNYWIEKYFAHNPAEMALSLGCGFGAFERGYIQAGAVENFHAFDISEGAINAAKTAAESLGIAASIKYEIADLDRIELPQSTYDAIFAISSAHHIFSLEHYFRQCRKALKPGGFMFLDEYIGPTRIQCPPHVVEIINRIRALLPDRLKVSAFTGEIAAPYQNSSVEHFETTEPSEAIRSGELVSILKLHFDIVEVRNYGGAILHMLLSGIIGNFDESSPEDIALLKMMALLENELEKTGYIQSDQAAIVARPKPTD